MPATLHYQTKYQANEEFSLFSDCIRDEIEAFLNASQENASVTNLYQQTMAAIEKPLLKATQEYTMHNQTQSAVLLGLNRGTFRTKLALYGLG